MSKSNVSSFASSDSIGEVALEDRIVVGVTGASGVLYARALLDALTQLDIEIHLVVSSGACVVMKAEMGVEAETPAFDVAHFIGRSVDKSRIIMHDNRDLAAPPSSGTFRTRGMVVCPCSMKTMGQIASGTGDSLIARSAEVCLKERRRLVLVPRESPLSLIHLRNMTTITEAGGIILPAAPGFYHRPQTIDDLLRHIVLKIFDAIQLPCASSFRWKDG